MKTLFEEVKSLYPFSYEPSQEQAEIYTQLAERLKKASTQGQRDLVVMVADFEDTKALFGVVATLELEGFTVTPIRTLGGPEGYLISGWAND